MTAEKLPPLLRPLGLFAICAVLSLWTSVVLALGPVRDIGWRMEVSGAATQQTLTLVMDVPASDQGQMAQHFLAASFDGKLYCFTNNWALCPATIPAYSQGPLPARLSVSLGTYNTVLLRGARLYAGYGSSAAEMLAAGRYRQFYTLGTAASISWQATQTVPATGETFLAFNNTPLALRDNTGALHLVWSDGSRGFHGRHDGNTWQIETLPKVGNGSYDKPSIGLLADGELVVGWTEQAGNQRSVNVTRSQGGRSRWEPPLTLASGVIDSPLALQTVTRSNGQSGAVVAWIDEGSSKVQTRAWPGSGWTLADWSAVTSPAASTAVPHDVTLASVGDSVWASWEDKRGGGSSSIYLAKSSDGGMSWGIDRLLPLRSGNPTGGDPSLVLLADGSLVLGFQSSNKPYFTRSTDGGTLFETPVLLGQGLFVNVSANNRGSVAFIWESFSGGNAFVDSAKTVGSALSLDALLTITGPNVLPDSATAFSALQAAVSVSQDRIDVFWIDTSSGPRLLKWRSGLLVN